MAGILMVFALSSLFVTVRAMETSERLDRWQHLKDRLCSEQERLPEGVEFDCGAGVLSFQITEDWFDFGSAELKEPGQVILRQVVPLYLETLRQDATLWNEQISAIEFGGHADKKVPVGKEIENVRISTERAKNVMLFLLEEDALSEYRADLFRLGKVIGYGDQQIPESCFGDSLFRASGECPQARRVDIRIDLAEEHVLDELLGILRRRRGNDAREVHP